MAQRLFVTIHNGPSSNRQQDPKVRSNPQGTPRHHDGLRINVHSEPYQPISSLSYLTQVRVKSVCEISSFDI